MRVNNKNSQNTAAPEYFSKKLLTEAYISDIILPTNAIEQKQVGMGSAVRELPVGARQGL